MRKRSSLWALLFLGPLALSSCGPSTPSLSAYLKGLSFREGFSILQLSDLHWSFQTDRKAQKAYLFALFSAAKDAADSHQIDLLIVTGDSTSLSNQEITKDLFDFLASWQVPFLVTWGNHDRQAFYPFSWLETLLASYSNSLYVPLQDQIDGAGNSVIDLVENGQKIWQIYGLDSGSYQQSGTPLYYDYGTISANQVEWFEKERDLAPNVPALAYFHIPTRDWQMAFDSGATSKKRWEKNESISSSEHESPFFTSALQHNVKGLFCGHDHANDLTMTYQGIVLGYGLKTGSELYYAESQSRTYLPSGESAPSPLALIGGSLVTLHPNAAFDLDHLYLQKDAGYTLVKERY